MANQFADFSALKSLKKELEKAEAANDPKKQQKQAPQQRSKTVQHLSREEEQARSIGIQKGQTVRMMDSNDSGVIVGIGKGYYEVEIDGLVMRATRSEFVLTDKKEDRMMYAAMPSRAKKINTAKKAETTASGGNIVIDLHMERIPGNENIPQWAALEFQMNYFRQILRQNLKYKGRTITFIHGDGDGTLKNAVRKELDEVFAISCSYTYGSSNTYGNGATVVTIR